MQDMKALGNFLYVSLRRPVLVFWLFVLALYFLSFAISYGLGMEELYFQASLLVYLFSLAVGWWLVFYTLPYLLQLGASRTQLFLSYGLFFLFFSFLQALLANGLMALARVLGWKSTAGEVVFSTGTSTYSFSFHHLSQFLEKDSFLAQMTIDTILTCTLLVLSFVLALFFYRFGLAIGLIVAGSFFLLWLASIATGYFVTLVEGLVQHYSLSIYFTLFGLILGFYFLSYVLFYRLLPRKAS